MKLTNKLATLFVCALSCTTLFSCGDDDDRPIYTFGFIPALSIEYHSDSIQPVNQATNIYVTFMLKNSCQEFLEFKNLDTSPSDIIKDVGIYGAQTNYVNCEIKDPIYLTKKYKFIPKKSGENIIRLWTGKANDGTHQFITKTIYIP